MPRKAPWWPQRTGERLRVGRFISEGCIEASKAGGGIGKHTYSCNGYVESSRRWCECWCHENEAESLIDQEDTE